MKFFIFALCFAFSVFAFGEESQMTLPSNTTQAAQDDVKPSLFLKDIYSDFGTTFHGPTLDKLGPYSQNANGKLDPSALAGFDSEAYVGYVLDHETEMMIGPSLPFFSDFNKTSDKQFVMGDVGVKFWNKKTIRTDNFMLATNAYVQAPASDAAKAVNMNFALRTTPFAFYDIPNTRWRVGTWSDFRYLNGVKEDVTLKAWVGPYVSYKFNDKIAFNLMYETEAHRDVGQGELEFHNILADFQPGVIWQITKHTKLNPYVILFPSNSLATDTTGLGFVFYSQLM